MNHVDNLFGKAGKKLGRSKTMKRVSIYLLVLSLGISGICYAQTTTVAFQQNLNGYTGVFDTYIQVGAPDNILEGRFEWEVDGSDAGAFNYGIVQFQDIFGSGSNQIPLGARIVRAELTNFISNSGSSSEASRQYNLLVPVDFPTASLTTTFGGDIAMPSVHYAPEPFTENNHAGAGTFWTIDITPLVQALSEGAPNNGFLFIPNEGTSNGFGFVASEAAGGTPRLIVETASGTVTFQDGVNGYSGIQDAWIANDPNLFSTPLGTRATIDIENDGPADVELGLIRFDNLFGGDANQIAPGTQINRATLRMAVSDTGGDIIFVDEILPHSETVAGVQINTRFDESTVTFENFVADGFFPQSGVELGESVTDFTPSNSGLLDIDVTSSLQRWTANTTANLGWLMESTGGGSVSLTAKEGGTATPKLTVTYEGAPAEVHRFMLY